MSATDTEKQALDKFRNEIDAIDDQIHDLLMRRTEVVHGVAQIKNEWIRQGGGQLDNKGHPVPSLAMRPDREASIFRRLAARHTGDLPFHVIVQLWRELINAKTRLQGPLAISLSHGDEQILPYGSRDLARASYGAATTLRERETPLKVLEDVMAYAGVIGVLPQPVSGEANPWWPQLLDFDAMIASHGAPRIIARLPCIEEPLAPAYPAAWTIACFDQADSGDDTSFLIFGGADPDDEKLIAAFHKERLDVSVRDKAQGWIFIETSTFLAHDDPRLETLCKALDGQFLRHVGGFANPVVIASQSVEGDQDVDKNEG